MAGIVTGLPAVMLTDATALAAILGTQLRLRRVGRWLAVAAASDPAVHASRVTGLTRRMPLHATPQDAIRAAREELTAPEATP